MGKKKKPTDTVEQPQEEAGGVEEEPSTPEEPVDQGGNEEPEPQDEEAPPAETPPKEEAKKVTDAVIEHYFNQYMGCVKNNRPNEAMKHFYDIVSYLKNIDSSVQMDIACNVLLDEFRKHYKLILSDDVVTMAFSDEINATREMNVLTTSCYTLFAKLLTPNNIAPGSISVTRVQEMFGEELFKWFNKKYPKKTFV